MMIKNFFSSFLYFLILSGFTLFVWVNHLDYIGMSIFVFIAFLILVFVKNTIHTLPFFLNMLFMISHTEWSLDTIPIFLYLLPLILMIGFAIHYFKFKDMWIKGRLTLPLLIMFLAVILSVLNVDQVTKPFLYYLVIGLIYFMTYLFFLQTIEGDYLKYIIRLFVVLGFLVSLQVLIYYAQSGDILIALESDRVHLGWGISNSVATYLIVFISITLYYVKTKPWFLLSTLLISFEIIMLLFTLSRAGVLSFVALLPFGLFYLYYKQENKLTITLYLMILLIILSTIFVIKSDYFTPLYERFKDLKFTDGNGRVAIWKEGIQTFFDYPIFGKGIFARVDGDYFGFYHNTFIHTLASLGTIGLISLLWQIIAVIWLFSKRLNLKTGVILLAFIGANIHGLFDNVYFMPQFMVIYLILVAILEAYDREEKSYRLIWRPPYVKK